MMWNDGMLNASVWNYEISPVCLKGVFGLLHKQQLLLIKSMLLVFKSLHCKIPCTLEFPLHDCTYDKPQVLSSLALGGN